MMRPLRTVTSLSLLFACGGNDTPTDPEPRLPAVAARSTAIASEGRSGLPLLVTIQGVDMNGRPAAPGGPTVALRVRGANPGDATVTDEGDGTWTARYTPARPGVDSLDITLDDAPIADSPLVTVVSLAARGTATTDGRIDAAEWANASRTAVFSLPALAGSEVLVMNDDTAYYVAVRVVGRTRGASDRLALRLDNTLDSVLTAGDDAFNFGANGLSDSYFNGPFYALDTDTVRGAAAATTVGTESHWEFRRPLIGGVNDLRVTPGARVGLCVMFGPDATTGDATSAPRACLNTMNAQRRYFPVRMLSAP